MGAPNLIRGGSHSGNIAASKLDDLVLLDVLSSDYVPSILLLGAIFKTEARKYGIGNINSYICSS